MRHHGSKFKGLYHVPGSCIYQLNAGLASSSSDELSELVRVTLLADSSWPEYRQYPKDS